MNCPRCGTEKIDGKPYCPTCGNKYGEEKKDDPKKTSEEQDISLLLALILIFCIALVFLTGIFPQPL